MAGMAATGFRCRYAADPLAGILNSRISSTAPVELIGGQWPHLVKSAACSIRCDYALVCTRFDRWIVELVTVAAGGW
jgi:hypothetical protein